MRDMHKWKDKAEFSLDNRQIFFLFFGLSVVGCFIFALGIMTGRRLHEQPSGQMATIPSHSLDLLDAVESSEPSFAFKEGIKEATDSQTPPTRDPSLPPRDEKAMKAEREGAEAADAPLTAVARGAARATAKAESAPTVAAVAPGDATAAVVKAAERAAVRDTATEPTLASTDRAAATADKPAAKEHAYTLQMKAFSHAEEAATLADKLRRNGHAIRVEQAEVKGRTWHRVRLGRFIDYDAAIAAKEQFEQAEHVIAYVVAE